MESVKSQFSSIAFSQIWDHLGPICAGRQTRKTQFLRPFIQLGHMCGCAAAALTCVFLHDVDGRPSR